MSIRVKSSLEIHDRIVWLQKRIDSEKELLRDFSQGAIDNTIAQSNIRTYEYAKAELEWVLE